MIVEIKLSFLDWKQNSKSVYQTGKGLKLSAGALHSGSTFRGAIELDDDDAEDLALALKAGCEHVFRVWIPKRKDDA